MVYLVTTCSSNRIKGHSCKGQRFSQHWSATKLRSPFISSFFFRLISFWGTRPSSLAGLRRITQASVILLPFVIRALLCAFLIGICRYIVLNMAGDSLEKLLNAVIHGTALFLRLYIRGSIQPWERVERASVLSQIQRFRDRD